MCQEHPKGASGAVRTMHTGCSKLSIAFISLIFIYLTLLSVAGSLGKTPRVPLTTPWHFRFWLRGGSVTVLKPKIKLN